ncbi:MAG: YncE family protein [Armatimonadota bacterium]|nr:YncE family protein [Armatimonadota bacterium]
MIVVLVALVLAPKPSGIAVVVNQHSDTASIVDIASYKVVHVPVGIGPHESSVSPNGKRAVVTNYFKQGAGPGSSLSVLDLDSKKEVKRIELDRQAMPHGVEWVDDRKVVCTDERNQRLLLVDVDAGKVEREYETGQAGSHMLSLNLGADRLVGSNMGGGSVTIFDFKTGERLETVSTGKECEGVGISPDGKTIWAGNRAEDTISVIDTATRKVVKRIDSQGFPYRVQFTPNGKWALIPHATSGELVVCDVAEMKVVRRIKVGAEGVKVPTPNPSPAGVWPMPDSNFALVTIRNDNSVVIVDLHNGQTLGRIEVQKSPDGVSMKPTRN